MKVKPCLDLVLTIEVFLPSEKSILCLRKISDRSSMNLALATCCFLGNSEHTVYVVFGGKALKSYIPITLSFTDKDFDETLEYLESVLIEKSVSKTLREIFISECFRFHNVLKGAIIPPLEKLNPNQTYRIEKGDKVYTTIDQILADETSIGKIMNINLLK